MGKLAATAIHIEGIVQGVGFRPLVYSLAKKNSLNGWVRNTSAGVDIWIEGSPNQLASFQAQLPAQLPPLAKVDKIISRTEEPQNFLGFEIRESNAIPGAFQPISPDICTCPDCLRELNDPQDRRYRYPFINCTNCGPRFTIIGDVPYDRSQTTMASFQMCPECAAEYADPLDRRFHAQPIACPACGPQVSLLFAGENNSSESIRGDRALLETQKLLQSGKIVAIKGLGGFHLACDAMNPLAVDLLRLRKLRVDKPFAVMLPTIADVEAACLLSEAERDLLESKERPIVILKRRPGENGLQSISPRQDTLGVMLPYTPLHYLLFTPHPQANFLPPTALVMTSGNLSEEPIAVSNEEAVQRLSSLADAFLLHDRPIFTRCDDSVLKGPGEANRHFMPIRRSRGYAPFPVDLSQVVRPTLAFGAELKNTFCLAKDRYAFMSHHIGDLQNYETLASYLEAIDHYQKLFHIDPEVLGHDLHPDYFSARAALELAERKNIPAVAVQHHHAHIASCMAENHIPADNRVIGVAFDGTGYGTDEAIWGGEFLLCSYANFDRAYHLQYVPLPGGDKAVHKPARTALAYLWALGLDWEPDLAPVDSLCADEKQFIKSQLEHRLNAPLQSSAGRLFDAVSSLIGICQAANYEAQAAIELEAIADAHEQGLYSFDFNTQAQSIGIKPLLEAILADLHGGLALSVISAKFHNCMAQMVCEVVMTMRNSTSVNTVALSGGVWQNTTLLNKTMALLKPMGMKVITHNLVPSNDGGIALGQCIVANIQ